MALLGLAVLIVMLASCGHSSDSVDDSSTSDSGAPTSPDTTLDDPQNAPVGDTVMEGAFVISDADDARRRFEALLSTSYSDADNYASWICTSEGETAEYRLLLDESGARVGERLDNQRVDMSFAWQATSLDAVLFSFAESGQAIEYTSLGFDGDDDFRADAGDGTEVVCRRQVYEDGHPTRNTAEGMPVEADRDTAESLLLEERATTRYGNAQDYDFWFCDVDTGEPVGYVLAAPGRLAPVARAVTLPGAVPTAIISMSPVVGWSVADGATLVLTPEDSDGQPVGGRAGIVILGSVVFPVDTAFTATRQDGANLQCLLQRWSG